MDCNSITLETIVNLACTIVTTVATILALAISVWAGLISKKQYLFSTRPIVECYLTTYKTDNGTPFLVLVTENFGPLTARNIKMQLDYPNGIDSSAFGNELVLLEKTPFTLAPHAKLSTPICWNRDMGTVVNGEIKIQGKFCYSNIRGKSKSGKVSRTVLTVNEFNLFNAVNKAGGQQ